MRAMRCARRVPYNDPALTRKFQSNVRAWFDLNRSETAPDAIDRMITEGARRTSTAQCTMPRGSLTLAQQATVTWR